MVPPGSVASGTGRCLLSSLTAAPGLPSRSPVHSSPALAGTKPPSCTHLRCCGRFPFRAPLQHRTGLPILHPVGKWQPFLSGIQDRRSCVAHASDFDGGDDDIIEFDAEDADLDDDVEDDLPPTEDMLLGTAMLDSASVIETSLIADDVAATEASELSTPGEAMPDDFRIDEEQFHRIPLYLCDFYIRRSPDADDDVYDLSEVYVTPPASSAYSTPTTHGALPTEPRRCTSSEWTYVTGKTMPYSSDPYHASAKEIQEVTKVFLIRHLGDERASSPHFALDFEEIYVLDGQEKSIRRAHVQLELPEDEARDRSNEMLVVRDDGTTFKIIPREWQRHVDDVINEHHWHQTRESVESYLRGFRDFESSNWF